VPSAGREPGPGQAIRWDLRVGQADVSSFPRGDWSTCLQRVVRHASGAQLDYPPAAGVPELRAELASYLGRVRAVLTRPEQMMVTSGFAQGLSLLCHLLREQGHDSIAVEDPGHPSERRFIEGIGLRVVAIPVDGEGMDVDALAASRCRAVLVTPAHQFPTGAVLSPRRRAALVAWAQRRHGLVIEDDYDGEFWYGGAGRPAGLQPLDPDRVAYGGSASKSLAPGLRLGWLAVPAPLMPALERIRRRHDLGVSTIDQYAYTMLIQSGRLDRHLRRINKRYRERREALVRAVATGLPGARVTEPAAGLYSFVALPDHIDEAALVPAARRQGVLVQGVGHFACERPPPSAGLIVEHAKHPPDSLAAAVAALGRAARSLPP
jgi:GntR family transcriptional regulator/MocR family aminotransferase